MKLYLSVEGHERDRYLIGEVHDGPRPDQLARAMRRAADEMELWAAVREALKGEG